MSTAASCKTPWQHERLIFVSPASAWLPAIAPITVMARVSARSLVDFEPPIVPQWEIVSYIARSVHGWQLHHPEQGPQMGFNTAPQVADFLAFDPGFSEGWSDTWNQWMLVNGERFASE
jgi:hypothetical protein